MAGSAAFEAQCAHVFENWDNIVWHRIIVGGQHQHIPDARDALAEDIIGGGLLRESGPESGRVIVWRARGASLWLVEVATGTELTSNAVQLVFPTSVLPSPEAVALFESEEEGGAPRSLGVCVLLRGLFPRGSNGNLTNTADELVAYRLVFPHQSGGRASCLSGLCSSASDEAALQHLRSDSPTFGLGLGGADGARDGARLLSGSGGGASSASVALVAAASEALCVAWTRQDTLVLGLSDGSLACAQWDDAMTSDGNGPQQQQQRAAGASLPRLSFLADESRLGKLWSSLRGRGNANPVRALTTLPPHDELGRDGVGRFVVSLSADAQLRVWDLRAWAGGGGGSGCVGAAMPLPLCARTPTSQSQQQQQQQAEAGGSALFLPLASAGHLLRAFPHPLREHKFVLLVSACPDAGRLAARPTLIVGRHLRPSSAATTDSAVAGQRGGGGSAGVAVGVDQGAYPRLLRGPNHAKVLCPPRLWTSEELRDDTPLLSSASSSSATLLAAGLDPSQSVAAAHELRDASLVHSYGTTATTAAGGGRGRARGEEETEEEERAESALFLLWQGDARGAFPVEGGGGAGSGGLVAGGGSSGSSCPAFEYPPKHGLQLAFARGAVRVVRHAVVWASHGMDDDTEDDDLANAQQDSDEQQQVWRQQFGTAHGRQWVEHGGGGGSGGRGAGALSLPRPPSTTLVGGASGSLGCADGAWECAKADCSSLVGCRSRFQELQRKVSSAASSSSLSTSMSSSSSALTSVGVEQRLGIHLLSWFLSEVRRLEGAMVARLSLPNRFSDACLRRTLACQDGPFPPELRGAVGGVSSSNGAAGSALRAQVLERVRQWSSLVIPEVRALLLRSQPSATSAAGANGRLQQLSSSSPPFASTETTAEELALLSGDYDALLPDPCQTLAKLEALWLCTLGASERMMAAELWAVAFVSSSSPSSSRRRSGRSDFPSALPSAAPALVLANRLSLVLPVGGSALVGTTTAGYRQPPPLAPPFSECESMLLAGGDPRAIVGDNVVAAAAAGGSGGGGGGLGLVPQFSSLASVFGRGVDSEWPELAPQVDALVSDSITNNDHNRQQPGSADAALGGGAAVVGFEAGAVVSATRKVLLVASAKKKRRAQQGLMAPTLAWEDALRNTIDLLAAPLTFLPPPPPTSVASETNDDDDDDDGGGSGGDARRSRQQYEQEEAALSRALKQATERFWPPSPAAPPPSQAAGDAATSTTEAAAHLSLSLGPVVLEAVAGAALVVAAKRRRMARDLLLLLLAAQHRLQLHPPPTSPSSSSSASLVAFRVGGGGALGECLSTLELSCRFYGLIAWVGQQRLLPLPALQSPSAQLLAPPALSLSSGVRSNEDDEGGAAAAAGALFLPKLHSGGRGGRGGGFAIGADGSLVRAPSQQQQHGASAWSSQSSTPSHQPRGLFQAFVAASAPLLARRAALCGFGPSATWWGGGGGGADNGAALLGCLVDGALLACCPRLPCTSSNSVGSDLLLFGSGARDGAMTPRSDKVGRFASPLGRFLEREKQVRSLACVTHFGLAAIRSAAAATAPTVSGQSGAYDDDDDDEEGENMLSSSLAGTTVVVADSEVFLAGAAREHETTLALLLLAEGARAYACAMAGGGSEHSASAASGGAFSRSEALGDEAVAGFLRAAPTPLLYSAAHSDLAFTAAAARVVAAGGGGGGLGQEDEDDDDDDDMDLDLGAVSSRSGVGSGGQEYFVAELNRVAALSRSELEGTWVARFGAGGSPGGGGNKRASGRALSAALDARACLLSLRDNASGGKGIGGEGGAAFDSGGVAALLTRLARAASSSGGGASSSSNSGARRAPRTLPLWPDLLALPECRAAAVGLSRVRFLEASADLVRGSDPSQQASARGLPPGVLASAASTNMVLRGGGGGNDAAADGGSAVAAASPARPLALVKAALDASEASGTGGWGARGCWGAKCLASHCAALSVVLRCRSFMLLLDLAQHHHAFSLLVALKPNNHLSNDDADDGDDEDAADARVYLLPSHERRVLLKRLVLDLCRRGRLDVLLALPLDAHSLRDGPPPCVLIGDNNQAASQPSDGEVTAIVLQDKEDESPDLVCAVALFLREQANACLSLWGPGDNGGGSGGGGEAAFDEEGGEDNSGGGGGGDGDFFSNNSAFSGVLGSVGNARLGGALEWHRVRYAFHASRQLWRCAAEDMCELALRLQLEAPHQVKALLAAQLACLNALRATDPRQRFLRLQNDVEVGDGSVGGGGGGVRAVVTMRSLRMEVATTQARVRLLLAARALASEARGSSVCRAQAQELANHLKAQAEALGCSKLGGGGWAAGGGGGGGCVLLPSPQDVEELVGLLCESGDFDAAAALSAAFLSADLSPVGVSQPPKAKAALLSTLMANGVLPPPPASSASYGSSSSEGSDVNHGRKLLGAVVASLARACVKLQVAAQPDPSASGAAATARSDAANESGGGGAAAGTNGLPVTLRLRGCRWGWEEPLGGALPTTGNENAPSRLRATSQREASKAWAFLKALLVAHDRSAWNFELRTVAVSSCLDEDARVSLPLWLTQGFASAGCPSANPKGLPTAAFRQTRHTAATGTTTHGTTHDTGSGGAAKKARSSGSSGGGLGVGRGDPCALLRLQLQHGKLDAACEFGRALLAGASPALASAAPLSRSGGEASGPGCFAYSDQAFNKLPSSKQGGSKAGARTQGSSARARDEVVLPEHGDDVWVPYTLLDRLLALCHAALGLHADRQALGSAEEESLNAAAAVLEEAVVAAGGKEALARKVAALEDAMRSHFEKLILRECFMDHTRRVAANEVH